MTVYRGEAPILKDPTKVGSGLEIRMRGLVTYLGYSFRALGFRRATKARANGELEREKGRWLWQIENNWAACDVR